MSSADAEYKLTAIVLVYNGEPFLRPCLESLVEQTLEGLEILLINDASTDDSLSICREFEMEYDNVRVVDKEMNEGLATSANMGIKMAKGEYIILVDNDDIVPEYAYEKLYNKAHESDSDICIGRANYLIRASQGDMSFYETYAWAEERIISDVAEYPEIFQDAFYWNKIIRRKMLIENDIELPYGMIYADRSFSHRAYIHANRIAVIPDCVYLWRMRKSSLSMQRKDLDNYINRIDSYKLDLDEITDYYNNYFKILVRRVIIPIRGMLNNEEFEEYLMTEVYDLIAKFSERVDDLFDNDLLNEYNIIVYLILKRDIENLRNFLQTDLANMKDLISENGKCYWNLPQFRNPEYDIPDEFFEIRYLSGKFIPIGEVRSTDDSIIFDNIRIPQDFPMETAYIVFKGLTNKKNIYADNCFYFELEKTGEDNVYRAEVPLDRLNIFDINDIYFRMINSNRIPNEFRINRKNLGDVINGNDDVEMTFSIHNHLEIITQLLDGEFEVECDKDELKIKCENGDRIKKNIKLFVENDSTTEKVRLIENDEMTEFALDWKFFLDPVSTYSFNALVFNDKIKMKKQIPLTNKHMKNFKEISLKNKQGVNVKVYEASGKIKLKSD